MLEGEVERRTIVQVTSCSNGGDDADHDRDDLGSVAVGAVVVHDDENVVVVWL